MRAVGGVGGINSNERHKKTVPGVDGEPRRGRALHVPFSTFANSLMHSDAK